MHNYLIKHSIVLFFYLCLCLFKCYFIIYEYVCKNCGYEFEKFQQMTEDHLKTCPECGKDALKRKIGAGSGVIFVGSGFYCNDYKGANASLGNPTSKKSASAPAKPAKKASKK